jgi:hypothetical protein
MKTYNDLINCTMLPNDTAICFIDDMYYDGMVHDRVYYIKPYLYSHGLSTSEIIHRFIISSVGSSFILKYSINVKSLNDSYILKCKQSNRYKQYNSTTNSSKKCDIMVAKKMMYHIKEFVILSSYKINTYKKRAPKKQYTMKRHT